MVDQPITPNFCLFKMIPVKTSMINSIMTVFQGFHRKLCEDLCSTKVVERRLDIPKNWSVSLIECQIQTATIKSVQYFCQGLRAISFIIQSGEYRIRTCECLRTLVFKTSAINRSANSPIQESLPEAQFYHPFDFSSAFISCTLLL